jgi:dethiobiotin synthase
MATARTIFIIGTDTSVGKTAVTALLLAHAQAQGMNVRALKPFSTGGTSDEALLSSLQKSTLQINFFHYDEPVSPWTAAKKHNQPLSLDAAIRPIQEHRVSCELLLIEGAGGLLTPLGERFSIVDLIGELNAEVIVVAANRLGVLNHTLLTVEALRNRGINAIRVALVEHAGSDGSRKSNFNDLRELLRGVPIIEIPHLENYRIDSDFIRASAKGLCAEFSQLIEAKKNALDTEAEGTFP